jgi:hypothetical protein
MPTIADAGRVRSVDILEIAPEQVGGWAGRTAVPGAVVGSWTGEQVGAVLSLVTALPEAEQMRCFVPRYALRLRDAATVLGEIAFCFRCRNGATVSFEPEFVGPAWFTFDPDSTPARQLLSLLRAAAGAPAAVPGAGETRPAPAGRRVDNGSP